MGTIELRAMNKRWYRRDPVTIDALVYCDGLFVAKGRTANLGPGGAYLRLSGLMLMPGSFLEVELQIPNPAMGVQFRFPARVVHSSRGGAGVIFEDFDRVLLEEIYAWRRSLYSNVAVTMPSSEEPLDDIQPGVEADTMKQSQ